MALRSLTSSLFPEKNPDGLLKQHTFLMKISHIRTVLQESYLFKLDSIFAVFVKNKLTAGRIVFVQKQDQIIVVFKYVDRYPKIRQLSCDVIEISDINFHLLARLKRPRFLQSWRLHKVIKIFAGFRSNIH